MIGRSIAHFFTLKYEQRKFKKLGYHVVTVDRTPDFILETDYRISLVGRHKKVAVLFAQPFEYTLGSYDIFAYCDHDSNVPVGVVDEPKPKCYTGISISNTHSYKAIKIGLASKTRRMVEFDHEILS